MIKYISLLIFTCAFLNLNAIAIVKEEVVITEPESPISSVLLLNFPKAEVGGMMLDGNRFGLFRLVLNNHTGKVINWIEIRNTEGQPSMWDTTITNPIPIVATVKNHRLKNQINGSLHYYVPESPHVFDLYVFDNGSIREGETQYETKIGFEDGEVLVIPVQRSVFPK